MTPTSKSKSSFVKIQSSAEKRLIWAEQTASGLPVLFKNDDEIIFEAGLGNFHEDPGLGLVADVQLPSSLEWKNKVNFLCTFPQGQDRYFYMGDGQPATEGIRLVLNYDLYRIEKRTSFRVEVPRSVPVYINIVEIESAKVLYEALVSDISPRGARIYFVGKEQKLSAGTHLKLQMHPPFGKTLSLSGEVRHVRSMILDNELIPQYGIEFVDLTADFEKRLLSLTMEMQKKYIMGFANHTDPSEG